MKPELKQKKQKNEEMCKLEELKTEVEEQKDKFLRLAAEYENFRKRAAKEKSEVYEYSVAKTVEKILPFVDSLRAAIGSFESLEEEHKKGFELIKNQMETALKNLNVTEFGNQGEEFDPNIHSAITHIEDDQDENKNFISNVFQKGYKIGEKIIRPAVVQVTN